MTKGGIKMNKKLLRGILFVLILTLIAPTVTLAEAEIEGIEQEADLIFFAEVLDYVMKTYPFEVNESHLIEAALKGMLQSLDPYSDYYTKEEAASMYGSLLGTFSGIGIYIEEKDGYINVMNVIKGQPAEKAGLKKDDLIIRVDDIDIKDMGLNNVSTLIKGPKGTKVKLQIKRGQKTLTFEVKRDTILINPVHYEIMENNIGYIQLEEFNTQATIEIKKALDEFQKKNVKKVILDLRDNLGGLLNQAISISNLFVPKGPVVHIREKNKPLETHNSNLLKTKYELVVLVNEYTASASEILAGAIKDTKAGTLVGTKTFGKGVVQSMNPIADGSLLKLTTGEWLTPNKTSINGIGIEPHILVENTEEDFQLLKAIEILK